MKNLHFKSASFQLQEVESEDRIVKGYASVFDNLDSDLDTMKKGAFKRSIKSWGPEGADRIKLIPHHKLNEVEPVAKITKMMEDDKGLYFEAQFGTHTKGEDYYRMVKEGIITEFSVGFQGIQGERNKAGGIDFTEVKLFEISLVTIASNPEAIVTDVKEIKEAIDAIEEIEDKKDKQHEVDLFYLKLAAAFDSSTQLVDETLDSQIETKSAEETFYSQLAERLSNDSQ